MYIAAPEHSDREIDKWISRQAHNTFGFYILNIVKKAQFIEKNCLYTIFLFLLQLIMNIISIHFNRTTNIKNN